jgi:hypothetical protein
MRSKLANKQSTRAHNPTQKEFNGKEEGDRHVIEAKRNGITEPQATSAHAETGEVSAGNLARDEEIRRRAYEIYLERGEQPGRELNDWLQAERELKGGVLWRVQAG